MIVKLSNFELVGLPNVDANIESKDPSPTPDIVFTLNPKLTPLIEKLAKQTAGKWHFQARKPVINSSKDVRFDAVFVFENGRPAGRITCDEKWRGNSRKLFYNIQNYTITKKRGAKNSMSTSNLNSAFRLALTKLGAKDDAKLMKEKVAAANDALHTAETAHSVAQLWRNIMYDTSKFVVGSQMLKYVSANQDAFRATLDPAGVKVLDGILEGLRNSEIVSSVSKYHKTKIVVWINDAKWYVKNADKVDIFDADSDAIPEHIRRKVGMLKLLDANNRVLEHVGLRVEETLFSITPEEAGDGAHA